MQELKIVCYCGQKYKFDVEPVNGKMPFTVKCPICNLDGTTRANEMLAQQFAVPPKPPQAMHAIPPPPVSPFSSAPPPPAPVQYAAPPPQPYTAATAPIGFTRPPPPPPIAPVPPGFSINRPPAPIPSVAPPPLVAAGMGMAPPPIAGRPSVQIQQQLQAKASGQFSLALGIVGGVVGAVIGCGLMYAFYYWVGFRFPFMGVAVGATAGYGARLLARGTDTTLGILTAVVAGLSVSGTYFLMYGDFVYIAIISIVLCCGVAYRAASG